ncbi:hypothetical protein P2G88_13675 [Aliiglaciecola sp. CAU 1673]|uniref:hypothetical protein n=1 Tax=Aliiglaciecola sp. CAU 1673 TaxID=3032595 RepID=UPI0023DB9547|nr:hypothetical protein [Aliiglaciecola sp. CAU 1673]MDF2179305.1 hypothetical protein [Aliiglaciecola sp. CAU 1673]
MKKLTSIPLAVMAVSLGITQAANAQGRGNDKPLGAIYVTSQGLYYDTFKTTDLPPRGRFQQLFPDTPMGPSTDYGPGDPGYVGGRWWVDTNNDGMMDELDTYFSCPLLGPGREEP